MKKTAGRTEPISQEMDGGGWIKLHRKALDSDIFADPDLWRLFTWCLLSAGHTGRHVPAKTGRGNTLIRLGPGQFVYGRKTAARDLHWPESTLNDRMKRLEATEAISIKPDTHFSIVTVVNWGIYQGSGGERRHPSDTQATGNQHPSSRQPTGNRHPSNTNKNVEKGKKGKKAQKGEKARDDDDDDVLVSWGKARERAQRT